MRQHPRPPDLHLRSGLLAAWPWLPVPALAADAALRDAMRRDEALCEAARGLRRHDLSGCVRVSTSRPFRMCEAAAGWAGISRMGYGEALIDAGPPR